ncbi:1-phosphatidylinositol 4,5-bisphosphate phosphodiesterase eta-2a isoform X2 [Conger conger]|uniref:1-phosphatidylinositol 4,5-bisphosphate phosphodiesterase eta-2a isoform X2 n=1 Tax=Conger conger TaxID=82655 RepID=UPI002A5B0732|nr:1-phosphatidylinositol 4,5-bisphosphate phosphodiesterase eta-2a isoform X2 [Conger conger]
MEDSSNIRHLSPEEVEKCMSSMQTGTQMVKLRGGSKGLVRFYYLDEHKSCIRWRPSRKNERAKISIDSIREVCEGKQSEIFQRYSDGSFDPNCCFSIYYGEHMESLDLVSTSGEEARTWITGLKYLMAGISDEDSLAKRQRTRDQWLKQTFAEADKNGDGSLSISEVLQLLHKLNVNLPRQKVKQMFKEADTDENQGTLGFEEFCTFYKMMSTRRDLYLLMLTYSNHKDHMDTDNLTRFLEVEQKMTNVTKEHCLEIVSKFEPCPDNQQQGVLGIDGFTSYMRSPSGDIFNPEHYEVNQPMTHPLCDYFIASSHNTYLMGDQLMSQSRVDMYAWVLQAGCRCVEVDCWDGQDGEPIVHHGYTLTSKILFKDVIETINKYAFVKNPYPVILSIENHCSVPQQKKMAQYLMEVLGDQLDLSTVNMDESGRLPSPEGLKGKILVKGKKLPSNIDEDAEEGDVSDEDSADEMEDDCKLMNGDTSMNRKQVENVAKKKLDSLMKESKIRDREDPDNFTITALPPSGKLHEPGLKPKGSPSSGGRPSGKGDDGTDTADEATPNTNKRLGRSFMGSFSKRKKKTAKLKKTSSLEDTDTDQESSSSASKAPLHHSRKKKTMKLSRALSDLVKYTKSVGVHDIEAQASACSWQVSSFSETKAHQTMQQKPAQFIHFNQRQLSRIYPSSYRVDSSNFNPQPFWNSGCHLVALNYQSEGRVLQLNRAKFYSNGNCGYILKPACMCEGAAFNPMLDDPLPNRLKKQLVLKIISGQQLPKPKDSMLGDRGEIIDPFVEVEIIGLPVDCCKEQTRVVDDNGFNPMWEETLVFTLHMPEIALVRFLVWDHDPIGQDFIGQRTIAFTSMMTGYRHVYLEGMEEASIFVHIAVNEISGKVRQVSGIKGLFHRNPKQASLDSHAAVHLARKPTFGAHLLRRTASAPTKGQPKVKKGFPEISIDTKDFSSEGGSEEHQSEAASRPRFDSEGGRAAPRGPDGTNGELHPASDKGKSRSAAGLHRGALSEPLRRANRMRPRDPGDRKPGVFARVAVSGTARAGVTSNCIKCVIGSKESPEPEKKVTSAPVPPPSPVLPRRARAVSEPPLVEPKPIGPEPIEPEPEPLSCPEPLAERPAVPPPLPRTLPKPLPRSRGRQTLDAPLGARGCVDPSTRNARSSSVPRRRFPSAVTPVPDARASLRWQCPSRPACRSLPKAPRGAPALSDSDSSSCDSVGGPLTPPPLPPRNPEPRRRAAGTLQREMNALFIQKMEEIRSKSPMFFTDPPTLPRSSTPLQPLETIAEESEERNPSRNPSVSCPGEPLRPDPPTAITPSPPPPAPPHGAGGPGGECREPRPRPPVDSSSEPVLQEGSTGRTVDREPGAPSPPPPDLSLRPCTPPDLSPRPCTPPSDQDVQGEEALGSNAASDGEDPASLIGQRAGEAPPPVGSSSQRGQVPRGPASGTPVRRTKSEGHVRAACAGNGQWAVPEVCTDATLNDRLWSRLEAGSHRDSVSSSSSLSSNDTVIDLSLPNLARKSLPGLPSAGEPPEEGARAGRPRSGLAGYGCDVPRVTKSKSNPNLRGGEAAAREGDELRPRALAKEPPRDQGRLTQRRHTWSRLYMEGLKQASSSARKPPAVPAGKPGHVDPAAKSKSLGDLTSDDIACNFDSKYRSISRSFVVRPHRDQRRPRPKTPDNLQEQLRRLTDVEPLTASDFAPAGRKGDREQQQQEEEGEEEEEAQAVPLRRSSSRSQSRVRYIANRAKQAQERQRLLGLARQNGSPIEERGNPEGACTVARSPCASLDLLSQLPSLPPALSSPDDEVFFTLKL